MLDITEDYGLCDYERLKQYTLLKTLVATDISQEVSDELELMINRACLRVDVVAEELGEYLFHNGFKGSEKMFDLSEIKVAEFLLSRCIKLCDESEPMYFNFLLVTAFLKESVFHFFLKYKCFRILYVADFCLEILYDEVFWKGFNSKNFYKKLKLFCQEFFNRFSSDSTSCALQDSTFGKYCIDIVDERLNVIDDSFSLDETNVEVFEKYYSLESIVKREEWPILRKTEIAESAYFDARKYYTSNCETCGSKCSDYLNYMNFF
ncbi:hypothetical protein TNCT_678561 [Trichonephila clavata]|uniref:Uncharacterized protein n=1 Tax=Trichonephila clavata TaxID=2740835 RepID=A0A8X6H0L8_TRICU|nr:hypothetical protein TNCT_678561 [Trichonephila clavata]